MNIWSYEFFVLDIVDMVRYVENFVGNVIGWFDFYDFVDVGIKKIELFVVWIGKF